MSAPDDRFYVLAETPLAALKVARRIKLGSIPNLYRQTWQVLRAYNDQLGPMLSRYYPFEAWPLEGTAHILCKRKTRG